MQDAVKGTCSENNLVKAWKAMRLQLVATRRNSHDSVEEGNSQQPQGATVPVEAAVETEAGAVDQAAAAAQNLLADPLKDFVLGEAASSAVRPKVTPQLKRHLF